jgi:hypothetical protein
MTMPKDGVRTSIRLASKFSYSNGVNPNNVPPNNAVPPNIVVPPTNLKQMAKKYVKKMRKFL